MAIKILCTVLVMVINYLIFRKFNKQTVKLLWIVGALVYAVLVVLLNNLTEVASPKLPFFLLIFSASLIILNIMARMSPVMSRSNLAGAAKMVYVKDFIVKKLFVLLMSIFQLLLIWSPGLLEKMTEKHPDRIINTTTNRY